MYEALQTLASGFMIAFGILFVAGAIKAIFFDANRIHDDRRNGRGLGALFSGEIPNGRDRSQVHCVNGLSILDRDSSVDYRRKAKIVR